MEKVRPWCGQPSDRGRLKNRTGVVTSLWPTSLNTVSSCHAGFQALTSNKDVELSLEPRISIVIVEVKLSECSFVTQICVTRRG